MRYDEFGMPEAAPLVYSSKLGESPKGKAGYGVLPGTTSFTRSGKRFVKSCAGALEKRYGKKTLFGTITLAGSTPQACAMLAAWSAKSVELLRKWLHYHVPGCCFVYVWEWQKRGALHLHLALGADSVEHLRRARAKFKAYIHTLHDTLSRLSGTDMFERDEGGSWKGFPEILRSRLEDIRKSVKRYLSKYLSKGSTADGAFYPSRWWGCNQDMRALVSLYREQKLNQSTEFDELVRTYEHQVRCWLECKIVSYSWSECYHPHNRTTVVYPAEEDEDNVWESLVSLLRDAHILFLGH